MYTSRKHKENFQQMAKFHSQYQARRDMFNALDKLHKHRKEGNLKALICIAEHELGYNYQVKSEKIIPRKNEFITEICNLIGLAHLDKLKLPHDWEYRRGLQVLAKVFSVSLAKKNETVPYVFGVQSTYRDPGEPDTSFLQFKDNIHRLDERMKLASLPIEKWHLYHELGKENLRQSKFDEARAFARKIMDESGENYLWRFVGKMLMLRADVKQINYARIVESLERALVIVELFQNPRLTETVKALLKIATDLLNDPVNSRSMYG